MIRKLVTKRGLKQVALILEWVLVTKLRKLRLELNNFCKVMDLRKEHTVVLAI